MIMNVGVVAIVMLLFSNESIKYKNSLQLFDQCTADANRIAAIQGEHYKVFWFSAQSAQDVLERSESVINTTVFPKFKSS